MRKYDIGNNLIHVIRAYRNELPAQHSSMAKQIGEWFHTTVGVRQGCIVSPTLFNIVLERIMSDELEELEGTVSLAGRTITNIYVSQITSLAWQAVNNNLHNSLSALTKHQRLTAMEIKK